jgi:hypothetical protein
MGSLGLGSLSGMLDSMEMLKRAWAGFSLPSNLTPPMDLAELDQRIADLKAVEQWLNVNLGMLRGTIQGLEIQRGTLAAIKSFGESLAPGGQASEAMSQAMASLMAMQQAASGFGAHAAEPGQASGASTTGSGAAAAPRDDAAAVPPAATPAGGRAPSPEAAESGRASGAAGEANDSAAALPGLAEGLSRAAAAAANPTAWWNLLQSQFNQVAQAAIAGTRLADAPAPQPDDGPAPAPRRRPAKKAPRRAAKAAPKRRRSAAG